MDVRSTRLILLSALLVLGAAPRSSAHAQAPSSVLPVGVAASPILAGVGVPAGKAYFWTSGTVPPLLDSTAARGTRERYGDTKTQGINTLKRLETLLKGQGLSLKDVVYLRVYVAPDKAKNGAYDFQGWFDAYAQFFNNPQNPGKTARSTVGVAQLVDPDLLIEIEAVAIYP